MVRIVVDRAKCVGDPSKICVEICPAQVLRLSELQKLEIVNEEDCIMCRTCQANCPRQAIKILA